VIHHRAYKSLEKRTGWSYGHIFTGRAAVILGMVNGGLGLQLADARRSYIIAYGVFAGLMGVLYIGAIVYGETRRGRTTSLEASREPKRNPREDSGSDSDR
jgi:hypothetical protein